MNIMMGAGFIFGGVVTLIVIVALFFVSQSSSLASPVPMEVVYIFGGMGLLLIIIGVVNLVKGIREKNNPESNTPARQLEKANRMMNKGLTGKLVHLMAGEQMMNQANDAMQAANQYFNRGQIEQQLMTTGRDGVADVLMIQDTGGTINNMYPIVILALSITPSVGYPFQLTIKTPVSRLVIPRVGDRLRVRYNPDNTSQIIFPDLLIYQ